MKNRYSDFTQDQIAEAKQNVVDAQAYYDKVVKDHRLAVESGQADLGGSIKVLDAQRNLDSATNTLVSMLLSSEESTQSGGKSFPWSTIGIAAGAIAVIVVLYKTL